MLVPQVQHHVVTATVAAETHGTLDSVHAAKMLHFFVPLQVEATGEGFRAEGAGVALAAQGTRHLK